ncbi:MAG TPA: sigma-70 family RNA polymerase sigma factor [Blastocatellia bacterium]|nr:sigma-70 family RNA polymerase sigma factor [Blastocatellia bacterium]
MIEPDLDGSVIDACRAGDRTAFRILFEAYKDRVYSMALHFCGNEATATDITQQVFLKVLSGISQFRRDAELTTWLYRIVANTCVDEHRSRRKLVPLSEGIEVRNLAAYRNEEERIYRRQIAASVKEAIAGLRPKLRLPILLRYVEGLSYDEIARVLDCSKGTVASRLNRGHKALAAKLGHLAGAMDLGVRDV